MIYAIAYVKHNTLLLRGELLQQCMGKRRFLWSEFWLNQNKQAEQAWNTRVYFDKKL